MAKSKVTPSGTPAASKTSAGRSASGSVFEVNKIRELIELMQEHDLNEVDLKQADQRIRLRRGAAEGATVSYAPAPVAAQPVSTPAPAATAAPADNTITINSPTIGTF